MRHMKTKTVTMLAAAVVLALGAVQFGRAAAGGLQPPDLGNVRLEGRVGEKLCRCLDSRVYSGWARGPSPTRRTPDFARGRTSRSRTVAA